MVAVDLLVVGGTGLLGGELVRLAALEGRTVAATHHQHESGSPDARWIRADLADVDAVLRSVEQIRPRAVVNAAYVQRGETLAAVTAEAPGHLAQAALSMGARFVHVSSDVVFAGDTERPRAESDPTGPVSDYGRAKVAAEATVAAIDSDAAIVRTSLLWGGPDGGPQERLVADPDAAFFTNQVRCPLRVDRLAAALLELADRPELRGIIHVAGSDAIDRLAFARLLAPLVGVDPASQRGVIDDSGTRPNHIHLDTTRARRHLASPLPGVAAEVLSMSG